MNHAKIVFSAASAKSMGLEEVASLKSLDLIKEIQNELPLL
jgi:hypothetical protein